VKLHVASPGDFPIGLELPWEQPLQQWTHPGLVTLVRGLGRNPVRFVAHGGASYAIKELPEARAVREYGLLRSLVELDLPAVEPVCLASGRSGEGAAGRGLLMTRYLDRSMPLRSRISAGTSAAQAAYMVDAMADLLVRLHLAGFFWGDCSLSNTLFRRDAGRYAAYLVDAETGELHPELSDGQRMHELLIATENLSGELMDIERDVGLPAGTDPVELGATLAPSYERLWATLHRVDEYPLDRHDLVEARIQELNALGFDAQEVEIETIEPEGCLQVRVRATATGHHRRLVKRLVGLDVQENQARRLLNDIDDFRAMTSGPERADTPLRVAANRWLNEVYHPILDAVPPGERAKLDDAELYHQLLEHRWYMSEREGRAIPLATVLPSYLARILEPMPGPALDSAAPEAAAD
jgi:hypothetical protein